MKRPARHHELAFALVMYRPGPFPRRVNPRLDDFQDEEIIFGDEFRIPDLAFQAGITFGDERGLDARGGHGREAKGLELVHAPAGSVPAGHHRFRQLHRGDVDHAFPGCLEAGKRIVPVADHAAHERRLELHHQMPRHRHDVRPPGAGRGEQHDRAGFEQPIDFGQGKVGFLHRGSEDAAPDGA
jgi:hypothetical protein